jgi:hypothetical protein
MRRIEREAKFIATRCEATMFRVSLVLIVAILAQTLQPTEVELLIAACMPFDVIGGGCGTSNTSLLTASTPWLVYELSARTFAPRSQPIPTTPGCTLVEMIGLIWHKGDHLGKGCARRDMVTPGWAG